MVKHVVMWRLKPENKEKNLEQMEQQLRNLKKHIPQIKDLQVGIDFSNGAASMDICLIVTLENKQALEEYRVHTEHQKVVAFINSVVNERVVVDFIQ